MDEPCAGVAIVAAECNRNPRRTVRHRGSQVRAADAEPVDCGRADQWHWQSGCAGFLHGNRQ